MSKELLAFLNQMNTAAIGMAKELPKIVEDNYKKMSKEDAENLKKAMVDSDIIKKAEQQAKEILDFNKKHATK